MIYILLTDERNCHQTARSAAFENKCRSDFSFIFWDRRQFHRFFQNKEVLPEQLHLGLSLTLASHLETRGSGAGSAAGRVDARLAGVGRHCWRFGYFLTLRRVEKASIGVSLRELRLTLALRGDKSRTKMQWNIYKKCKVTSMKLIIDCSR